ncbi:MAG: hypothetical protein P8Z41_12405 [Anaerolineales bacterium]
MRNKTAHIQRKAWNHPYERRTRYDDFNAWRNGLQRRWEISTWPIT